MVLAERGKIWSFPSPINALNPAVSNSPTSVTTKRAFTIQHMPKPGVLTVGFSTDQPKPNYFAADNQEWTNPSFSFDEPISAGSSTQHNSLFMDWDTESIPQCSSPCGPSTTESPIEYHSPYIDPDDESSLSLPSLPNEETSVKVEEGAETVATQMPNHEDIPATLMSAIELALRINAAANLQSAALAYSVALQASVEHEGEFEKVAAAEETLREAWCEMEAHFPNLG